MYTRTELTELLTLDYPNEITHETNEKRDFNITTLKDFILKDIEQNSLIYQQKERRILLYTTSENEEIYIQYPGKYSVSDKNGIPKHPYDFKPIACIGTNHESIDLDFQGIWRILYNYMVEYKAFMPIVNNLFFRLGRMIGYQMVQREYPSFLVYNEGTRIESSESLSFPMYQFSLGDSNIMPALNYNAPKINVGPDIDISLEAFLYYMDSLIQIEDLKYKQDSVNNKNGRINTSDSLIVIYAYYIQTIDLPVLLQRFVNGRGIAFCEYSEYAPSTNNTVQITNTLKRIENLCDAHNVIYHKKKLILEETEIPVRICLPQKHIIIVNNELTEKQQELLFKYDWYYYNIFDYLGSKSEILDSTIIGTPYYFDFDFEFDRLKTGLKLKTIKRNIEKKGYCTITPYCNFVGKSITLLHNRPTEFEISFLHQKGYSYYVKTDYRSLDTLTRLLTYINNL